MIAARRSRVWWWRGGPVRESGVVRTVTGGAVKLTVGWTGIVAPGRPPGAGTPLSWRAVTGLHSVINMRC